MASATASCDCSETERAIASCMLSAAEQKRNETKRNETKRNDDACCNEFCSFAKTGSGQVVLDTPVVVSAAARTFQLHQLLLLLQRVSGSSHINRRPRAALERRRQLFRARNRRSRSVSLPLELRFLSTIPAATCHVCPRNGSERPCLLREEGCVRACDCAIRNAFP